jgi:hypothetical protein
MTFSAQSVIDVAQSQVNIHETFSNGHWDNGQKYSDEVPGLEWSQHQAWCATFVSWVFQTAGANTDQYPVTASVWDAMNWWKARGRWSEYPAIGAQVIYGINGNAHTGVVVSYDDTYIYAVEGNTNNNGSVEGDGVYYKTRIRRDVFVHGYGYPNYPEGITSADPAWKKPTPVANSPFPGRGYFFVGAFNDYVVELDNNLIRKGFTRYNDGNGYQAGRYYSEYTLRNVKAFQESQGWSGQDADGLVGPETWKRLHS